MVCPKNYFSKKNFFLGKNFCPKIFLLNANFYIFPSLHGHPICSPVRILMPNDRFVSLFFISCRFVSCRSIVRSLDFLIAQSLDRSIVGSFGRDSGLRRSENGLRAQIYMLTKDEGCEIEKPLTQNSQKTQ